MKKIRNLTLTLILAFAMGPAHTHDEPVYEQVEKGGICNQTIVEHNCKLPGDVRAPFEKYFGRTLQTIMARDEFSSILSHLMSSVDIYGLDLHWKNYFSSIGLIKSNGQPMGNKLLNYVSETLIRLGQRRNMRSEFVNGKWTWDESTSTYKRIISSRYKPFKMGLSYGVFQGVYFGVIDKRNEKECRTEVNDLAEILLENRVSYKAKLDKTKDVLKNKCAIKIFN